MIVVYPVPQRVENHLADNRMVAVDGIAAAGEVLVVLAARLEHVVNAVFQSFETGRLWSSASVTQTTTNANYKRRDTVGWIVDIFFDPLVWVGGASVEAIFLANTLVGGIDLRAENLDTLDELEASSVDYYASIRNLYRQTRARDIRNGEDDFSDLPDFDDFDEDF